ncbi:MAG: DUF3906 family protein [Bacillales bacterium]
MSQELYLYRLVAEKEQTGVYNIIVLAPTEEKAFEYAEKELERYTIKPPVIKEWVIEEKKRVRQGTGYVLYG